MPRYFVEAYRRLFLETAIVADDKDTAENDARTLMRVCLQANGIHALIS